MVGQHNPEWWVNMVRNLHACNGLQENACVIAKEEKLVVARPINGYFYGKMKGNGEEIWRNERGKLQSPKGRFIHTGSAGHLCHPLLFLLTVDL
jgi:hypothetical protein